MIEVFDTDLSAIGGGELPAALADMEARVLAGIALRAERRSASRMVGMAAVGALAIGAASSAILPGRAVAADQFDRIAGSTTLAPSSLLLAPQP